jgi:flavin reductase (DIM6/NTAB) family NADH-FMN oxidoreductase RutF
VTAAVAAAVDARSFRDVLGRFATGVVIVTAAAADGHPVGMTINSFNAVSLDPPLVLFSVDVRARSLKTLKAAPGLAVNILARSQQDLSDRFARPRDDKWEGVRWRAGVGGAPLLEGAIAHIECERHACHDGGDHLIFVCRVVALEACGVHEEPLAWYRGRYCGLDRGEGRLAAWPLAMHY